MVVHLWDLEGEKKIPGWNYARSIEGYRMALCGYQRKFVTTEKSQVNCKLCLKKMNSQTKR